MFMSALPDPLKLAQSPTSRGRRWDHLELLERIDASGSISAAANGMGMSYKAAWQAVEAMNNLSEEPLVERQPGGKHGGGTTLTQYGRRVVAAYLRLEKERERVLANLGRIMDDFDQYYRVIRRFDMQTSARNRLCGTVVRCQEGAVNGEVILELAGGKTVAAIVTNDSIDALGLKVGVRACALIKASHIILAVSA
jgi:molybdate transport system regulatory protein